MTIERPPDLPPEAEAVGAVTIWRIPHECTDRRCPGYTLGLRTHPNGASIPDAELAAALHGASAYYHARAIDKAVSDNLTAIYESQELDRPDAVERIIGGGGQS